MRKKGQALVEFIIILPIFLMLVLGVIDVGKILYMKISLESKISDAISLYESGKNKTEIVEKLDFDDDKIDLIINVSGSYIDFSLEKKIDIITPGLNLVFDNPYLLEVSRSISNE